MAGRIHGLVGIGLLLAVAAQAPGSDLPAAAKKPVTVREIGTPLHKVAERLSSAQLRLTVAPELRDSKAIVIIREKPLADVMSRMAQVFGARWAPVKDEDAATYQLRRTEEVSRWIARWKASRARAAMMTREVRAARTRVYMNDLIRKAFQAPTRTENPTADPPGGIASVALTRFLGTLAAKDLDALARSVAEGSELHSGGEFREAPSPVVRRFADLNQVQQNALRAYIRESASQSVMDQLDEATVGFRVQGFIKLDLRLPDGNRVGDWVMAFTVRSDELEGFFHEALLHLLSRHPTPPEALLGASFKAEQVADSVSKIQRSVGTAAPTVRMLEGDRTFELPPVQAPGPLYREFLPLIADRAGLDVVSDYYTLSHRAAPGKDIPARTRHSLRELLTAVAGKYRQVFRQEGGFLLSRNYYWPDRDEEEAPYPLPERWIETKRKEGLLPLEELLRMARLTEPQHNSLCAYNDGVLSFRGEVEYLRRNRRVMAVLSSLSNAQLAELGGKAGLPIRALTPQVRAVLHEEFVNNAVGGRVPKDWQNAVLWLHKPQSGPRAGRGRVYALPPGGQPFWEARLPAGQNVRRGAQSTGRSGGV